MPVDINRDPTEPTLGDTYSAIRGEDYGFAPDEPELADEQDQQEGIDLSDTEILSYLGTAKRRARNYQQIAVMQQWEESEAAFRSQHHGRSKYSKAHYKNRSKYFKPKTRSAVFKNLLATHVALFSSADVMATEASDEMNDMQRANAALMKELLNQRLNNKTMRSGVPWLQIVLGARQQTQTMGMCASKAYWSYKARNRIQEREVDQPVLGRDGAPVIEFRTGQPMMQKAIVQDTVVDVIEDKPVVDLFPVEMLLFNPAASWIDPVATSPDLIVQCPMFADDVRSMMAGENKTSTPWRTMVTDDQLAQACFSENELMGLRQAREGDGAKESQTGNSEGSGSRIGKLSGRVIDVWENFIRRDGVDYHCWSLRDRTLLSDPVPVEEIYPAFRGQRPYKVGTDMIEAFVVYPESDVHSWQQQQQELNDLTNLRMDATRKSVYPTALVKAGKNIDLKAVQRQDSQNLVLIRDDGDVAYDRPPGPAPSAYQEMNYLNVDFDELAGQFSTGSVQTNRSLNETVGGMSMLSQNANAISEFKLALFINTWVEPVLSQLVMLEQYYEDDETLIAIAGKKAKLWQRFGIDAVTDEILESQVTVSINAGGGSSDPIARLMKFKAAGEISAPILAMGQQSGRIDIQFDEWLNEIWTLAGYKNGAERFIKVKDDQQQSVPADKVKAAMDAAQSQIQELRAENERLKAGSDTKLAMKAMDMKDHAEDRMMDLALAAMNDRADLRQKEFDATHDSRMQGRDHAHEVRMQAMAPPPLPRMPTMPKVPRPN